ncbi:putative dna-directed rna polymerase iii complex subunit rpc37 protein [Neofusicoccum parvum UCRNP2]|uniref:Putative dna-directed rna polymerase iii complex subunit rpc37 protein n=1 Tax=Botryosphaeria parva (strain UCR-NP2) TaxID=1287680 RepID=R1GQI9_BOTPV|nr:putative dna-directed rna polymerase iii complex subunit rpc37 protein [Neofusicoccum parvum UCRNP2]
MSPAAVDHDDDPVTAEYDVFITPELEEQIYLLQYPNRGRDQPYNERYNSKPVEVRMKPNTGFIEVDVPMNVHANYDKRKGVKWGEAMRKAQDGGESAFGLAAGFSGLAKNAVPARAGAAASRADIQDMELEEDSVEQLLQRFDDANDKGHVLNKQTLGGQIMKDETGKPIYMLGTYRGQELHLTKISGIVQMRPQFHHLDAVRELANANRRREREAVEGARANEPRAVQMTIKNEDGDSAQSKEFLFRAQEEKWTKLRYYDEETDEAFETYHEKMFVHDTENTAKLKSSMTNEQYLDAISAERHDPSGRSKKKPLTKKQMQRIEDSEDSDVGDDDHEQNLATQEEAEQAA